MFGKSRRKNAKIGFPNLKKQRVTHPSGFLFCTNAWRTVVLVQRMGPICFSFFAEWAGCWCCGGKILGRGWARKVVAWSSEFAVPTHLPTSSNFQIIFTQPMKYRFCSVLLQRYIPFWCFHFIWHLVAIWSRSDRPNSKFTILAFGVPPTWWCSCCFIFRCFCLENKAICSCQPVYASFSRSENAVRIAWKHIAIVNATTMKTRNLPKFNRC